jgi:transcriptional regulator with XRE-family HTH domain
VTRGSALLLTLDGLKVSRAELGQALRQLRVHKGVTVSGLAEAMGRSMPTIYQVEGGTKYPSVELFDEICVALDLLTEDVLGQVSQIRGAHQRATPQEPTVPLVAVEGRYEVIVRRMDSAPMLHWSWS